MSVVPPGWHFTKTLKQIYHEHDGISWEGNMNGGVGVTKDFDHFGSEFLSYFYPHGAMNISTQGNFPDRDPVFASGCVYLLYDCDTDKVKMSNGFFHFSKNFFKD